MHFDAFSGAERWSLFPIAGDMPDQLLGISLVSSPDSNTNGHRNRSGSPNAGAILREVLQILPVRRKTGTPPPVAVVNRQGIPVRDAAKTFAGCPIPAQ